MLFVWEPLTIKHGLSESLRASVRRRHTLVYEHSCMAGRVGLVGLRLFAATEEHTVGVYSVRPFPRIAFTRAEFVCKIARRKHLLQLIVASAGISPQGARGLLGGTGPPPVPDPSRMVSLTWFLANASHLEDARGSLLMAAWRALPADDRCRTQCQLLSPSCVPTDTADFKPSAAILGYCIHVERPGVARSATQTARS